MPVKRHHERPEVPAVIFQWGGSARRGGGAACSQASGTASETECVKAAEEMRGDWEGQGAVWGTSVRSEAERESGARGGLTCPAVDKGVRDGDNPLALLLVRLDTPAEMYLPFLKAPLIAYKKSLTDEQRISWLFLAIQRINSVLAAHDEKFTDLQAELADIHEELASIAENLGKTMT